MSPTALYAYTLIDYSYRKVLLAPGLRIGYLAFIPGMPEADREALRAAALHDHVFVPEDRATEALALLLRLSASAR